jgi:membrane associated rhomboid family serine protease
MFLPIRTDSPLRSTPWMNWLLIAANVITFLLQRKLWPDDIGLPALNPRDLRLWNYISYQFLHGDGLHLLGNMLFLYIFGNNVNDRMGHGGYLAFYLAGGVFAGIGHVLSSHSGVIGASGAVSAVTGAFLILLPRAHVTVFYFFFLIGMIEIPSLYFIIASFLWDFAYGFAAGGGGDGVAHLAHVSGTVFGVVVPFVLLVTRFLPRDQFDMFALLQRWNKRRQYQDMVRRGYDPFGYIPPAKAAKPDPQAERIQDLRAQVSEAIAHHDMPNAAKLYLELRAIDPNQVLSRQSQLDVANQLFAQQVYPAAADAYELFLQNYPKYDQTEQIQLMLGIIYSRYVPRPDKARRYLSAAVEKLNNPRDANLAREELAKIAGPQS